jgi:uncharacterized membrane protein YeaQ/YmgE (transglycosylase-associated protein family)
METTVGTAMGIGVALLLWLVIGGVIGWLASIIMKTNAQMGLLANVVIGIVGAVLGGWLANLFGVGTALVPTVAFNVIGAVILIAVLRMLGVFQ